MDIAPPNEGEGEGEEDEETLQATAEVIRQFSQSTELEPPPDWTPGQPIDLRPDVVARIRSQVLYMI
jgi:hypothetical protein